MNYILTASEMREADENTIQYFGVPQLVLMERAALAARDEIMRKWPEVFQKKARILIAVGNGNNGGDGAALARLFFLQGCNVTVHVSGKTEKYSDALKKQLEILGKYEELLRADKAVDMRVSDNMNDNIRKQQGILLLTADIGHEWKDYDIMSVSEKNGSLLTFDERRVAIMNEVHDIVIDALFGIGLSRELTGEYQKKTEWLNSLSGKKVSLDIPSGISADDGRVLGCAFRADLTVTFGFMKRGMLLYPGKAFCGETVIADIGITKESFLEKKPSGFTLNRKENRISDVLPPRRADSHKGSYGKVLLFAGSADTPGAALLAGEAVLRSGAGMLRLISPIENRELVLTRLPEAMYQPLEDNMDWEKLLEWCDCVVAGPGIGQGQRAKETLEEMLEKMTEEDGLQKPLILDADALNLIAASKDLLIRIKKYTDMGGLVIMTPHMAEFGRLLPEALKADRMERIEHYCKETGVILVSKDAATVAGHCAKDGSFHYYINQTGNSGMATAGSGDVLSGILGAFVGYAAVGGIHKESCFQAVCRGVYLHGLAGDRAAENRGEAAMIAGDIIKELQNQG